MALAKKPKHRPVPPDDPHADKLLAGRTGGTDDRTVTRSGRCPDCLYLIGSPGHEISCGAPG